MSAKEIVESIQQLSFHERLIVIEKAIKSLQSGKMEMEKAAKVLIDDYANDKNLTAFTSLDFENFYETK